MQFLRVAQMREADHLAICDGAIPEVELMCRAGAALAAVVEELASLRHTHRIVLVAGHGNNGGDAYVAARVLHTGGYQVQVLMTCAVERLKGSARTMWDAMCADGVSFSVVDSAEAWTAQADLVAGLVAGYSILVDGILGTGCQGAPSGAAAAAINWINQARSRAWVVAVDVPSGMQGDTGETPGVVVHADLTVTFARPKLGFLPDRSAHLIGHLRVVDIKIPDQLCDKTPCEAPSRLIALPELAGSFQRRKWQAHKGSFGHVCVMGGSPGYGGAPVMAALGALRSGVGLVSLVAPAVSGPVVAAWAPEIMWHDLSSPQGELTLDRLNAWGRPWDMFDVLVVGPGLSRTVAADVWVERILHCGHNRVVLDADGLFVLAKLQAKGWRPVAGQQLLLTPHPGEAAILLGVGVEEVVTNRLQAVHALADRYQATVILKGAGTLLAEPNQPAWLNRTGNPGMASGGMGDVLAGMVGALWAQGYSPMQAACLAVWAHGTAGDYAAWHSGQSALCATGLLEWLGPVFQLIERDALQEMNDDASEC